MATKPPGGTDRLIVYEGARWSFECAIRADGTSPAQVFLERLAESDQRKLLAICAILDQSPDGRSNNGQKFKKLEGDVSEFKFRTKDTGVRFPCFADGRTWVLTHGFYKKEDKTPPSEIALAHRIRSEDLSRKRPPKAGK